jgi:UDP-N-acetylmuramyl pentapeptide phosphotransferase/UDP-N-acetylglucosamine-1-phosphate transferase
MKKNYLYGSIIIFVIVLLYLPLFTLDYEKVMDLTQEDHIYENSQAIILLLSSGLMFFLFIRSKSEEKNPFFKTNRNIFFLLLGVFFFFCFGEEISWGQRIFGIHTPGCLKNINAQGETNIHNLWLFQRYEKNTIEKTGLRLWMSTSRLFAYSWLLYCVIIPILNYLSGKMRKFYKKINLPIVPLWIGFLFVLAYIISKVVEKLWLHDEGRPVNEISEISFYFLYLLVSLSFLIKYKKAISSKDINLHKSSE